MKYTIIILCLLTVSARGQQSSKADSIPSGLFSTGSSGIGPAFSGNEVTVSFMSWSNRPVKNVYDSGDVEIYGDTIKVIRMLARQLDSATKKFWDGQTYSEKMINAAAEVMDCHDRLRLIKGEIVNTNLAEQGAKLKAFIRTVRQYREFVYGKPQKKIKDSKVKGRNRS